jgi:hypothetical protein
MKSYFREAFDLSLARKMKRRDVIPASRQRQLLAQGQLMGVKTMEKGTREKLSEAYNIGFREAAIKAQACTSILAVAVLHDNFGFGATRAKKFAEELKRLTNDVNSGYVSTVEIVETLANEKLDFVLDSEVDDGEGRTYKMDWRKLIAEKKAEREKNA